MVQEGICFGVSSGSIDFSYSNPLAAKDETGFPVKKMFAIKGPYINAAYTHPMSLGSYREVDKFLNGRMQNGREPASYDPFERASVSAAFAKLINTTSDEIAWIPSTMVGDNLIVSGLELPGCKEHVVLPMPSTFTDLCVCTGSWKAGFKVYRG